MTRRLARFRAGFFEPYPDDHPDPALRGQPISREHQCECGRVFEQYVLSEAFLTACETIHDGRPAALVVAQCPGLYVPVHCPACERADLGRQAKLDELRYGGQPARRYHEAAD